MLLKNQQNVAFKANEWMLFHVRFVIVSSSAFGAGLVCSSLTI